MSSPRRPSLVQTTLHAMGATPLETLSLALTQASPHVEAPVVALLEMAERSGFACVGRVHVTARVLFGATSVAGELSVATLERLATLGAGFEVEPSVELQPPEAWPDAPLAEPVERCGNRLIVTASIFGERLDVDAVAADLRIDGAEVQRIDRPCWRAGANGEFVPDRLRNNLWSLSATHRDVEAIEPHLAGLLDTLDLRRDTVRRWTARDEVESCLEWVLDVEGPLPLTTLSPDTLARLAALGLGLLWSDFVRDSS